MLPFRFSRVRHWLRAPAPTLGQHNDDVLGELGYSPTAVERLRASTIVGDVPVGL